MADKSIISIPDYFRRFIDSTVDLSTDNKVCCPFHKEDTPSFSYSPERNTWRCFGACHIGGDVIALHQKNYKLPDRASAKASLLAILGIKNEVTFERPKVSANEELVRERLIYAKALELAVTVEDWLELDYIMSFHPIDYGRLELFCNARRK